MDRKLFGGGTGRTLQMLFAGWIAAAPLWGMTLALSGVVLLLGGALESPAFLVLVVAVQLLALACHYALGRWLAGYQSLPLAFPLGAALAPLTGIRVFLLIGAADGVPILLGFSAYFLGGALLFLGFRMRRCRMSAAAVPGLTEAS